MSPSQAMPPPSAAQAHRGRLAAELNALNTRFGRDSVSLGEVVDVLGENTYTLLVLLLALPFVTPVSLFGLSTAFGAAIAYFGIRLACGLQPRFPGRFGSHRLPPRFFGTLLRAAERVIRRLERCTRPRLASLTAGGLAGRVENWRGGPEENPWLFPAFPPSCPFRTLRSSVSSSRHIARSMRICRTTRSCTLLIKGYGAYRPGAGFQSCCQ
jgi:hypothetical protein